MKQIINFPGDCSAQELADTIQNIADDFPKEFSIDYFSIIRGVGGLSSDSDIEGTINGLKINSSLATSIIRDILQNINELDFAAYIKIVIYAEFQ